MGSSAAIWQRSFWTGDRVTVVDDLSTGRFENIEHLIGRHGFHFAIETITNETVMDRLISECDHDLSPGSRGGRGLIIQDPVRVIETNIKGCEAILRIGVRYRKKLILASTSEIYWQKRRRPFPRGCGRCHGPHHPQPLELCLLQGDGRIPGLWLTRSSWLAGGHHAPLSTPSGRAKPGAMAW